MPRVREAPCSSLVTYLTNEVLEIVFMICTKIVIASVLELAHLALLEPIVKFTGGFRTCRHPLVGVTIGHCVNIYTMLTVRCYDQEPLSRELVMKHLSTGSS